MSIRSRRAARIERQAALREQPEQGATEGARDADESVGTPAPAPTPKAAPKRRTPKKGG